MYRRRTRNPAKMFALAHPINGWNEWDGEMRYQRIVQDVARREPIYLELGLSVNNRFQGV
jgi:hypothetical protein